MTEQLDIIDLQFGLNQLGGNRGLLIKLLGKFTAEYQNLSERLGNKHANGDTDGYRQLVHTVKGVSGNLGLNGLHIAAKKLERSVLDGSDIASDVHEFNIILDQTFVQIEALAADGSESKPDESEIPAPAPDPLSELTAIIKRNEFLAPEKIAALLDKTTLAESQKMALSEAIGDLDYPEALRLIDSYTQ